MSGVSSPPYQPQLATLVDAPPAGDGWLHEIKFDGYRIGCVIRNGRASLVTRNGNDWTAVFPEVATAARELGVRDALIDGEVVVLLPDGRTSFQALQNASSGQASRDLLVYFVFDVLRIDDERLERLPLEVRKDRLRALVGARKTGRIRYADHVIGHGTAFLERACSAGLEGIVSKRRDLPYTPGRHGGWLKTKCIQRQELVVGGFTDPEGMRAGIGALLVGHYDGDRLVFAGKVGTGFTHKTALELRKKLEAIEQTTCPFHPLPPGKLGRIAHWVKPVLVVEVAFTEWTTDGKIRHPSFQGLRADKKPRQIVREKPSTEPGPDVGRTVRRSSAHSPVATRPNSRKRDAGARS